MSEKKNESERVCKNCTIYLVDIAVRDNFINVALTRVRKLRDNSLI